MGILPGILYVFRSKWKGMQPQFRVNILPNTGLSRLEMIRFTFGPVTSERRRAQRVGLTVTVDLRSGL